MPKNNGQILPNSIGFDELTYDIGTSIKSGRLNLTRIASSASAILPENVKFVSPSFVGLNNPYYTTIQGAIDGSDLINNILIQVHPGIYPEHLAINRTNLSFWFESGTILEPVITDASPIIDFSATTAIIAGKLQIIADTTVFPVEILGFSGVCNITFEADSIIDDNKFGLINCLASISSEIFLKVNKLDCDIFNNSGTIYIETDFLNQYQSTNIGANLEGYINNLSDIRMFEGNVDIHVNRMDQANNPIQVSGGVLKITGARMISNTNNAVLTSGKIYFENCTISTSGIFPNIFTTGDGNAVFLQNCVLTTSFDFCVDSPVTGFLYVYNGTESNKIENPATITNVVNSISQNVNTIIP